MAEVATSTVVLPAPFAAAVAAFIEPIRGAEPTGSDVKYDDDFLALKAEVDMVSSPAGEADFEKIVELGRTVLRDKSKDLMVVGYLTLGLTQVRGTDGLAEGWALAEALVDRYWEGLHPQKDVRRRNALQFMADRSRDWLQHRQQEAPELEERAGLEVALSSVRSLQGRVMEALGAQAPALSGVSSALAERLRRTPEPEPEAPPEPEAQPESEPAPEAQPKPEAAPAPSSAPARQSPASAAAKPAMPPVDADSDIGAVLTQLNMVLREKDPTQALPYRLLRAYAWDSIRTVPQNEAGMTLLWPPDDVQRRDLGRWVELEAHEQVIKLAELLLTADAFELWLTMQRVEVQAMAALGEAYAPAAEAIKLEVGLLVRRLPELLDLRFKDGTPYADPMTVEWIETEVLPLFGSPEGEGSAAPDPVTEAYQEARKVLGGGDLQGAIALLQQGGTQDASQEARFRRRLYLALLCLRADQLPVARSILEGLDKEVVHHALERWNPALTLEVWSNLYTCYSRLAYSGAPDADHLLGEAQQVLSRISQVDASHALSLLH